MEEKLKEEIANRFKGNNIAALIHYIGIGMDIDCSLFREEFPEIFEQNDNVFEMLEDLFNLFGIDVKIPLWMNCGE
jgi:hypothetical protein